MYIYAKRADINRTENL